MEGIAKFSPQEIPVLAQVTVPLPNTYSGVTWAGVPMSIYKHFGLTVGALNSDQINRVQDIYLMSKSKFDKPSEGDILLDIKNTGDRLSMPPANVSKYEQTYQWYKLTTQIQDLEKQRKALEF